MTTTDTGWVKASLCRGNSNCIEVQRFAGRILLRDTKDSDATTIAPTPEDFALFLAAAKAGEFDYLVADVPVPA